MNDLQAIEELKQWWELGFKHSEMPNSYALVLAIQALEEKLERENNGWISVEDRLPEDVLNHNGKLQTITVLTYSTKTKASKPSLRSRCRGNSTSNNWWWSKDGEYRKITHWKPLPQPPEGATCEFEYLQTY